MSRIKLSVRLRNKFDQILMKYEDETKMDERPLDLQHQLTILLRKIPGKEIECKKKYLLAVIQL